MKQSAFVLGAIAILSGCVNYPHATTTTTTSVTTATHATAGPQVAIEAGNPMSTIKKISVVGYGSSSSSEKYNDGQRKLMAMRASRLDAYRVIAEQVYGIRVTGGSTVGAMVATNDNFRVAVDAYLRGARVSGVLQANDGTFETTMEMDFDESIFRTYLTPAPVRSVTVPVYSSTVLPVYSSAYVSRGAVGPGVLYGSSYYYAE